MNKYHTKILVSGLEGTTTKKVIEANGMAWSDAGLYEFWKFNTKGEREPSAYYPVNRTIIEKIEYNADTKTK